MNAITLHHAEAINAAHDAAQAAARSAVQHALEAGRLLIEVKAGLEHGELTGWIAEHCRFSPRTARAYMKLARDYETLPEAKRQRVASLPFRDAVRELAAPKLDDAETVVARGAETARRARDLSPVMEAIDAKIAELREFVRRYDELGSEGRAYFLARSEITAKMVNRWREKLKDEDGFRFDLLDKFKSMYF